MTVDASDITKDWPDESWEAARLLLERRGEPDEATLLRLIWSDAAPWKGIVAANRFYGHDFPAPHIDAVESFVDYSVPPDRFSDLAWVDGSTVVERAAGEMSAR